MFFWIIAAYHVALALFAALSIRRDPPSRCWSGDGPKVAILYATMHDFRERAALSCIEQDYAHCHVFILDDSIDIESRAIVVELLAVSEQEVDESMVLDDAEEGPDAVRVFLSLEQARAFAVRAERVISAGRKPCPLCAEPLGPHGHVCPRQNGYRRQVEA